MDLLLIGVPVRLPQCQIDRPRIPLQGARPFGLHDQMLDAEPGQQQIGTAKIVVNLGQAMRMHCPDTWIV
jgi:hypothetical protein